MNLRQMVNDIILVKNLITLNTRCQLISALCTMMSCKMARRGK